MNGIKTIGLDLAKNVFHLVCLDKHGHESQKKMLKRAQAMDWFAQIPPCLVAMEACTGAHEWARRLQQQGHEVRLLAAQHVKAYVQGNKNDYNDARAIAEAVGRPCIRPVATKTIGQQNLQALLRLGSAHIDGRTAPCNRVRGLLAEYGLVLPQGVNTLRKRLPELLEDAENGLTALFRQLLAHELQALRDVDESIKYYGQLLAGQTRQNEATQRLQTAPGFGPVVASAFLVAIGDGQAYRRGRDVSASLGLVPRQHSSGGKNVLLGISKRGDRYLRSLLAHAARAVLRQAERKDDRLGRWAVKVKAGRGFNKAAVALANKLARIGWAILYNRSTYQAVEP